MFTVVQLHDLAIDLWLQGSGSVIRHLDTRASILH